jgi:parvulin-like peptidyl-prolyl isomerase
MATVNGTPIQSDVFDRELARHEAGLVSLGIDPEMRPDLKQQVMDQLIEEFLIRQLAASQGVTIGDDQVDANINQMKQEVGDEYFNAWLTSSMFTPEEFREVIRLQLITNHFTSTISGSVPITPDQVHARHILVNTPELAQEVVNRLNAGEDFATLAQDYSVDTSTRLSGGDLGFFPRCGLFTPEVEEAAFGMQPGQISGIIRTDWGYHIVQTLEFAQQSVSEETRQRMVQCGIDQWQIDLRNGADIQQLVSFSQ